MMHSADLTRYLIQVRPHDRLTLRGWIRGVLGVWVPERGVRAGHSSPLDYLEWAFFERGTARDAVIWANRGGGKTYYGALATLLDLIFKPGIQIRILGGSMEQSGKMHNYLRAMLDRDGLRELVDGRITERRVRLVNGSKVELLAQSERSVRGQRVQKLRCDEVELFDRSVWEAAQFVTREAQCGPIKVSGSIEAFSTMHRPFGLMHELVSGVPSGSQSPDRVPGSAAKWGGQQRRTIFRWGALDVMERCEPTRTCEGCGLWDLCGGAAKQPGWPRGFVTIDDIQAQRRRTSQPTFASEMLCERPTRRDAVFVEFHEPQHVLPDHAPLPDSPRTTWHAGADFGMRGPFVWLWACVEHDRVIIVDEYLHTERILADHLTEIEQRPWPTPHWIAVDPAGHQPNDQTGRSNIAVLRAAGYRVRTRGGRIETGLEIIRRRLAPADGSPPTLLIHSRCQTLITALASYHYPADRPDTLIPVKDGHDHPIDALRYLLINLEHRPSPIRHRRY